MTEHVCLNCAAPIARKYRQSMADWVEQKYCTPACFYVHKYPAPLGLVPQCQACGESIPRPTDGRGRPRWMRQKFCSNACRPKRPRQTLSWEAMAADFIEDVEDLLGQGVSEWEVCRRLDRSAGTIARRLSRWGRGDLATEFWVVDQRQRQAA